MTKRGCEVNGCDGEHYALGLCNSHWHRQRKGRPLDSPIRRRGRTEAERVSALLAEATPSESGCLIAPRLGSDGYATKMKDARGRSTSAHRLIYRVFYAGVDSTDQVHHTCANRACINPEHLQAVSQRENVAEMKTRRALERRIEELERENAELRLLITSTKF